MAWAVAFQSPVPGCAGAAAAVRQAEQTAETAAAAEAATEAAASATATRHANLRKHLAELVPVTDHLDERGTAPTEQATKGASQTVAVGVTAEQVVTEEVRHLHARPEGDLYCCMNVGKLDVANKIIQLTSPMVATLW